jgi:hypothetical protein
MAKKKPPKKSARSVARKKTPKKSARGGRTRTPARMAHMHLFICTGRFRSFDAMRAFIDETYTEDGDAVASDFIREVDLTSYEPMCIEAIHSKTAVPLPSLLKGASYGSQWLSTLPPNLKASAAICVFEPNEVLSPQNSSLIYVGPFAYRP